MATILCRLRPPLPEGALPIVRHWKPLLFSVRNLQVSVASPVHFFFPPRDRRRKVSRLVLSERLLRQRSSFMKCRKVGIPWTCYIGHLGPSRPKLEKESETALPDHPAPEAQKVRNGVDKDPRSTVFQLFWFFFNSVFDFLGRPRELIVGLFQLWARRAEMTPVAGKSFAIVKCSGNAEGSRKPWVTKFHGRLGC